MGVTLVNDHPRSWALLLCSLLGGVSPLVGIEAGAGRLALRRQAAFPSTLRHRLPTARTVSRAEAHLVEQMGQGTTCGSVCFLPSALVMDEYAIFRVRFAFQLNLTTVVWTGKGRKKARDSTRKRWFHHPVYDDLLRDDSFPVHKFSPGDAVVRH